MPIELIIQVDSEEHRERALERDCVYEWRFSDEMLRVEDVTSFNTLKTGGLRLKTEESGRFEVPTKGWVPETQIEVLSGTEYQED